MATKMKAAPKKAEGNLYRLGIITTPTGRRAWEPIRRDGKLSPALAKLYPDYAVEKIGEIRAGSFKEAREGLQVEKGEWTEPKPKKRASKKAGKK